MQHFLLIDSGAGITVTVLCLLVLAGVSYASYAGDSDHDGGDHGDGHGK